MAKPDFRKARSFVRKSEMPLTLAIMGIAIAGFLALWLGGNTSLVQSLAQFMFVPASWGLTWWSIATYWIVETQFVNILFQCVGMYFFAGALEQMWGTRKYSVFFVALLLICPLSLYLGFLLTGSSAVLLSLGFPVACCVVAWCAIEPNQPIMLWFVVPLLSKWVGWITALGTVFYFGGFCQAHHPVVGLASAIPILLSLGVAKHKIPIPTFGRGRKKKGSWIEDDYRGSDFDKRLETEADRRRLKELFERSVSDTDSPEN